MNELYNARWREDIRAFRSSGTVSRPGESLQRPGKDLYVEGVKIHATQFPPNE